MFSKVAMCSWTLTALLSVKNRNQRADRDGGTEISNYKGVEQQPFSTKTYLGKINAKNRMCKMFICLFELYNTVTSRNVLENEKKNQLSLDIHLFSAFFLLSGNSNAHMDTCFSFRLHISKHIILYTDTSISYAVVKVLHVVYELIISGAVVH